MKGPGGARLQAYKNMHALPAGDIPMSSIVLGKSTSICIHGVPKVM